MVHANQEMTVVLVRAIVKAVTQMQVVIQMLIVADVIQMMQAALDAMVRMLVQVVMVYGTS